MTQPARVVLEGETAKQWHACSTKPVPFRMFLLLLAVVGRLAGPSPAVACDAAKLPAAKTDAN